MGLREKVALVIVALSVVQITYVKCGSNANNLKFPMKMISKPKRTKWTNSKNLEKATTADESFKRKFSFPDVDYPLPPTFISTSYYNPKDTPKNDMVKQPRDFMKNLAQQSINKKNRKHNGSFKSPTKSFYITYPEDKVTQMPMCLNGKDLFPSVDYPLDASELWKAHYWERIQSSQPEVRQNVNDMSTKSKAKMRLSLSKANSKDVLKRKISNYTANTNVSRNQIVNNSQPLPDITEGIVLEPVSNNSETCSKTPEYASIKDGINATKECNNNKPYTENNKTQNNKSKNSINNFMPTSNSAFSSCDEKFIDEELYSIAQGTPSPIDTKSSYQEYVTPLPKIFLPLTTVAPFSTDINNINPAKELINFQKSYSSECNSLEFDSQGIGQDMASDEIGCTGIYPEVFSSLTTSTMAPTHSNVDSIWMDPELDNHTLNTYSDEVEQYYILV